MKKIKLFCLIAISFTLLCGCGRNKNNNKSTPVPSKKAATETAASTPMSVTSVPAPCITDSLVLEATTQPVGVQKEGSISLNEAISLLKTFLGSYDQSSGSEYIFTYICSEVKDGKDYYKFSVDTESSHIDNYLLSTDGNDVFKTN